MWSPFSISRTLLERFWCFAKALVGDPAAPGTPPHFFDGRSRGGAARARTGRVAERMAVAVETPDVELGSGLAGGLRVC